MKSKEYQSKAKISITVPAATLEDALGHTRRLLKSIGLNAEEELSAFMHKDGGTRWMVEYLHIFNLQLTDVQKRRVRKAYKEGGFRIIWLKDEFKY